MLCLWRSQVLVHIQPLSVSSQLPAPQFSSGVPLAMCEPQCASDVSLCVVLRCPAPHRTACAALRFIRAVKNKVQFFALRMLLGVSESGAFPGMW